MSKYKLILFDMDGTIANTDSLIIESLHYLYDKYNNGVRKPDSEIVYFSGPPMSETLAKEFPHMDTKFMVDEFIRISDPLYDTIVTGYPDMIEVISKLKKQEFIMGVVTSKARNKALHCLDVIKLTPYMDVLVGYDDVKNPKPHGEPILKAMEMVGISNLNEVIYLGDNDVDIETAYNAHVDSILVTWGPRIVTPTHKPTYRMNSFEELERIINHE